jgi:hypothetical protein
MDSTAAVWLVLLLAVVCANLPFVNQRLFVVGPKRLPKKGIGWQLIELLVFAALVIGIGVALEARIGRVQAQGWQFYAVMGCIFLTLAFPGFVWRHLARHKQ